MCPKFCRKVKRFVKTKIFGIPEPLADIDLREVKDKLKLDTTSSLINVLKNALKKDSKGNIGIKGLNETVVEELKRKYSIKGSKEKILNNMFTDYQKGKLSLSEIQTSNINIRTLNKKQVHKMLKDYEAAQREKYAGLSAKDLKNKFHVRKSQERDLEKMVDDLKKGKLSATAVTNSTKIDPKKLDQNKLNDMIQKYRTRPSFVAKKFSIKGSKEKLLQNFLQDYNKGKLSATKFTSETGFDPRKLSKGQVNDILNKYDADRRVSRSLFAASKTKIQDLIASIGKHPSIMDQARKMLRNMQI